MNEGYNKYTAYTYDLWGNDKDGYEVNDVYFLEEDIVIMDKLWDNQDNDRKLIKCIKSLFNLRQGLHSAKFEIDGDPDFQIYIEYDGVPIGMLRNQDI